uniref:Uncharacterized protein n=1 Tax=Oryza glumipatula TaxID=40148 RepID=A0A0E0B3B4_9ORYZ
MVGGMRAKRTANEHGATAHGSREVRLPAGPASDAREGEVPRDHGVSARAWLCGGAGPGAGRGLGGAAGVVVIPPSCGHRIQFKLYVLDDEVHLGNKASR